MHRTSPAPTRTRTTSFRIRTRQAVATPPTAARSTSSFVSSETMARVRVAVIMGGRSSEHDISVASARSVVDGLDAERYDVRAVEIGQDGRWQLDPAGEQARIGRGGEALPVPAEGSSSPFEGVDVVFPVLHGPFGEDGTVLGFLDLADVAYVGAGVTASALCMDKELFKAVMRDKGVPVVRSVTVLDRNRDHVEN